MGYQEFKPDWHTVNSAFEHYITCSTHESGVFSSHTSDLPDRLHKMPGLETAYFSYHASTREAPGDVTIVGEFAAVRTVSNAAGTTTKAYVYAFGMSSDGHGCFNGPYTDAAHHHHYPSSYSVPPGELFGFVPYPEVDGH
jgi:hypothetical protein